MAPVLTETDAAPADPGGAEPTAPSLSTRVAAWTFGIYVVVAMPLVVIGLGNYYWFGADDWDFLADRQIGSLHDLLRPHAEHWSTIPVLVYRLEWNLFGFTYWPYQVLTMALHLTAAVLIRMVMRRSGVHPWIATGAAALFVLFSPGDQNMLWSFQIGMVGSLVFGLTQLLLAGHDGGLRRADWLGLAAGLAALMCSGIGPVMVGVVGIAVLIRRGWRMALFHTVPLAVVYLAWYVTYRSEQPGADVSAGPMLLLRWTREGLTGAFEGLGYGVVLGIVLAVVLVVGLVVAWGPLARAHEWGELRERAADPAALLVGAVAFEMVTAFNRAAFGPAAALAPRYIYVAALLVLPALAVACDALARQWRYGVPIATGLLLIPIPGMIKGFDATGRTFSPRYFDHERTYVEGLAWAPEAEQVPRDSRPLRRFLEGEGPSVGWLVDARRIGQIPDPSPLDPALQDEITVRLALVQSFEGGADPAAGMTCRTYDEPIDVDPDEGDVFVLRSGMGARLQNPSAPALLATPISPFAGETIRIARPDLRLRFGPLAPAKTFELCS